MSGNAFLEFVERYGPPAGEIGPVRFVREVWGAEPDTWQEKGLRAYGRGERRISIRSCHGPGKTTLLAWLVNYQLCTRFPQKTAATAPTTSQLEDALVAEVLAWHRKLPAALQALFTLKKNRIELTAAPEESFFTARTARDEKPEALQGIHSEHVLLIADEASGVSEPIFEAAAGSMSGHNATTILAGNPVRTSGFFFDTHHKLRDMWFVLHVTGVPGTAGEYSRRVSADFVEDIRRRYGERSNAYRVRCLGEFPLSDLDTVIPYELAVGARDRDIVIPPRLEEVWGLDVARFGDDANALVRRNRLAVLPRIEVWMGTDLMETAGRVKARWDETAPDLRPQEILVDVIGLGAGVADRLLELGLPVRGVNVGEAAVDREKFSNLRSELWWKGREWLATRDHKLPQCDGSCARNCVHEQLIQELVAPRYGFTSSGKIAVEPKSEMKKRGHASPNVADAFLLTLASEPAAMIHGSRQAWSSFAWNRPIKRGRVVV